MSDPAAPATFDVPLLGAVTKGEMFGRYVSNAIPVTVLGRECRFVLGGYAEDDRKAEFDIAIANFLRLDKAALRDADEALVRYYKDYEEWWVTGGGTPLRNADEVWEHVTLGHEPTVTRRAYGDRGIYISVECECAWEAEHGLQLVFKNGSRLNKLGSYDGHLTNSDAYGDPRLEGEIYQPLT